jgi:glucose-1-phosphate adenylyltransferase
MSTVLSIILGGGRGTRLYPLTKLRSKPAVPIGGKYRLIDIPISNCINSDLTRIYVLTQFLSTSLNRHVANTYRFDMFNRGFVEILAAQQAEPVDEAKADLPQPEPQQGGWYAGTADAVRRNLRHLLEADYSEVLVLSGDQLYRMDFRKLIKRHRHTRADVTIAVLPVPREQVGGLGIVRVDDAGRVTGFVEKPQRDDQLPPFATPKEYVEGFGIPYNNRPYLASMGIYLFGRDVLVNLLREPFATDFGKDVFPRSVKTLHVQTHLFDGYWEDLGTIKSYHECHLALAGDSPPFQFHHPDGVVYTRMRNLPPSRIVGATLAHAVVSDGCVIGAGTTVERSTVGVRSRIGRNVVLREAVIIGADRYETDEERAANAKAGRPNLTVGDGTVIERAILDKDARVGSRVRIVNDKGAAEAEGPNYVIRDGIVVIPRGAVVPDGEVI